MKTQTNPQKTNAPAQVSAFNYHMKNKLNATQREATFKQAAHRSSTLRFSLLLSFSLFNPPHFHLAENDFADSHMRRD